MPSTERFENCVKQKTRFVTACSSEQPARSHCAWRCFRGHRRRRCSFYEGLKEAAPSLLHGALPVASLASTQTAKPQSDRLHSGSQSRAEHRSRAVAEKISFPRQTSQRPRSPRCRAASVIWPSPFSEDSKLPRDAGNGTWMLAAGISWKMLALGGGGHRQDNQRDVRDCKRDQNRLCQGAPGAATRSPPAASSLLRPATSRLSEAFRKDAQLRVAQKPTSGVAQAADARPCHYNTETSVVGSTWFDSEVGGSPHHLGS